MKNNWNNAKITRELKKNGYFVFKNYFSKKDLKDLKDTLLRTLNYIKPGKESSLQKKYYKIKKFDPKLKGHWYDISPYNINILQKLHRPEMIKFVKNYFNTKDVFSGRPAIHVHDDENDKLLDPHQETNQFARDTLVFWSPLFDTNKKNGGMAIYKKSHTYGYFDHKLEHPRLGKKSWTDKYTHIDEKLTKKFERIHLEVKAGSAVLFLSSLIHSGYNNEKNGSVRITITERFNPLKKSPFLKNRDASLKIPFQGVDYNKIKD